MVLPAAILEAEKKSEEALAALEAETTEDAVESTSLEDAATLSEEEQTPVAEPEVIPAEEVEEPEEVDEPSETDWEKEAKAADQRYKTLDGKYRAEVPLLHQQVVTLQQQIATLASSKPPAKEAAPVHEGPDYARHLEDSEVKEYDTAVLDLQARMARGVAEGLVDALRTEMKEEFSALRSALDQTADTSFWGTVEAQIPGAEEINRSDPKWIEFLTTVETVSGISYRDIGEAAVDSGDANKLISLFRLFKAEESEEVVPKKKVPSAKPKQTQGSQPKTKTESKPMFKESDVRKFYQDVAVGNYKGRDKEREKLERMIDQAADDNRIVSG